MKVPRRLNSKEVIVVIIGLIGILLVGYWQIVVTPTPDVTFGALILTGTELRMGETEAISINNCGSTAIFDKPITLERVIPTVELDTASLSVSANVDLAKVSEEIRGFIVAQLFPLQGSVESKGISLSVKPETNIVYYIQPQEIWKTGTVEITVNSEKHVVPFRVLSDCTPQVASVEEVGCAAVSTPTIIPTAEPILEAVADVGTSDLA